ncbi:MAG: YciI family protein, partial [Vicinamibacterales bacterium]
GADGPCEPVTCTVTVTLARPRRSGFAQPARTRMPRPTAPWSISAAQRNAESATPLTVTLMTTIRFPEFNRVELCPHSSRGAHNGLVIRLTLPAAIHSHSPRLYATAFLMQAGAAMFVIELMYKADLREIDTHMPAHVKFLKKHYASGHFLVSGRKIPRDGGIILAVGKSRQEIEAIVKQDPFCAHGLADFRIIEFRASQCADDIQKRIEECQPKV